MTAASGPEPQGVIVVNTGTSYNVTSGCSTVPAVAQQIPSMSDFLAGLQVCVSTHIIDNASLCSGCSLVVHWPTSAGVSLSHNRTVVHDVNVLQ